MKCKECYWCVLNHLLSNEKVCCNEKSENYNILFPKEEASSRGCEYAESIEMVEYRSTNPMELSYRGY